MSTDTEVIDRPPLATQGETSMVISSTKAMDRLRGLESLGFIVPVATPAQLREAFALRQKLYAAILAPDDYLYTVSYKDSTGGRERTKQLIASSYEEAMERAGVLKGRVAAKPLKSGVVKLARALGITAKRTLVKGLPAEPHASYSYVEYTATHEGTGISEIGIGWCDRGERNRTHDIIATADTRAYGRAILRLSGFGDISADEVVAGASEGNVPEYVPEPAASREREPLPPLDDPTVVGACTLWAEALVGRNGKRYAPDAKQVGQAARELRARARRGNTRAATQLGAQGFRWEGTGQDGLGYEPFEVEPAPVQPEQIQAAAEAAKASQQADADTATDEQAAREDAAMARATGEPAAPPPAASDDSEPQGWNLSSEGSDKDDTKSQSQLGIPEPDHKADVITTKQARNVSKLLIELTGTKDAARQWLADHCHVDRSPSIRLNQYEIIMSRLQTEIEKKEKHG